jgi:hypothetical protein
LFPGSGATGTDCSATSDGYTGGTYTDLPNFVQANWIGWVYTVRPSTAVCAGGTSCISTPGFIAAASRKTHGTAGAFNLPLLLMPLNPSTEPRVSSSVQIVMTFDSPISSATVAVTGFATLGTTTFSGNNVFVDLTGVSDMQYVTVALTNVSSTTGGTGGSGSVRVGFLAGDVNGSRVVSVTDVGIVNAALGQVLSTGNYLNDVNVSGAITVSDKSIVNAQLTHALPPP